DKPMASALEDARAVARAANETEKLAVALPFDAKPWMLTVVDVLRGGAIGKIVGLAIDQAGPGPPASRSWKYRRDQAGGGVLLGHGGCRPRGDRGAKGASPAGLGGGQHR